jgi:glycosyltransferase involved in cell wall biosynthesis
MNVLHVNNTDLPGRRFNGYDLMTELRGRGISGKQAVLTKLSTSNDVVSLFDGQSDEDFQNALCRVEERRSMFGLLFPWGRLLSETPEFRDADVVHYHLIHNQVISLFDFAWLMRTKPAVWTFHDPWPFTGHCVYPRDCEKWLSGCHGCPRLDAVFAMQDDHADRMWAVKKQVLSEVDADIVVASEFMLDMVRRSPLTSHLPRVHQIPFGIDTSRSLPDSEKRASRKMLGIPEDDYVLLFRATPSEAKGLDHIVRALASAPPLRPTTLLTLDAKGLIGTLDSEYRVVEFGWVEDEAKHPRILSACDVFLMPSTSEAFGLMAIEAMGAGRPVICFEGTSLPAVTHAPDCGISVPMGDDVALRAAIDDLSSNPSEAARRGELGRKIVAREYGHERYLDSMAALYRSVHERSAVDGH